MDISAVSQLVSGTGNQGSSTNSPIPGAPPAPVNETAGVNAGTDFGAAGTYVPGEQAPVPETFTPDMNRVRELWDYANSQVESFRRLVEMLLNQQAERLGLSEGWSVRDLGDIEITDEMRADAQALIDEGGYFSVEETARRLLDFAVAITGGDPSRIDVMRDAVQRGFDQAERMFGGELPQISHDTLSAVMEGFDQWAAAGSATAIALLN